MKNTRTFVQVSVLVATLVVALLLLFGIHTVIASSAASAEFAPDFPAAPSSATAWSTGWEAIPQGECPVFNHNLDRNPDDYAVELMFRDEPWALSLGIHRRNYGGLEVDGSWYGVHWQELTANTIKVCRHQDDGRADRVHIRVWIPRIPPDYYDSGWKNILPGDTGTFTHGLAITETDLTVGLWFSGTARGIHHYGYGGLAVDPDPPTYNGLLLGAHWHSLTTDTVRVTRHPDDTDVEQVRVIVTHGDPPHYDSLEACPGWQPIAPGTTFTFEHNLSWNPNMLLVRGECYSSTVGIHQWLAGGSSLEDTLKGTNIQNLTANTVQVFRWRDDDACPLFRVRVWKRSMQVYLPLIVRDH